MIRESIVAVAYKRVRWSSLSIISRHVLQKERSSTWWQRIDSVAQSSGQVLIAPFPIVRCGLKRSAGFVVGSVPGVSGAGPEGDGEADEIVGGLLSMGICGGIWGVMQWLGRQVRLLAKDYRQFAKILRNRWS